VQLGHPRAGQRATDVPSTSQSLYLQCASNGLSRLGTHRCVCECVFTITGSSEAALTLASGHYC
jgi:hypothetical protein